MQQIIDLNATVPSELHSFRLDQVASVLFDAYSRTQLQNWIKKGFLTIDGCIETSCKKKIHAHQVLKIHALSIPSHTWLAQKLQFSVVYEDATLLVINKPAGLVVHPGAGCSDSTLVNGLLYNNPDLAHLPRAGLVHRLDKNTSGLLLVAKTWNSYHTLVDAMKDRSIKRSYFALVSGHPFSGTVCAPIGRHAHIRTRMSVRSDGRAAVTHYRVLKKFLQPSCSLIQIELETGRTHQIRVHMQHIRYPILGDSTYGTACILMNRQALHAHSLNFQHPETEERITCTAEFPQDFVSALEQLEANQNAE